jgi:putative endonuclease
VGVTNNLMRRVYEHKNDLIAGFTKQYGVKMLVYYEIHDEIESAIRREKSIKRWTRNKKIDAIQEMNPQWRDLYETII